MKKVIKFKQVKYLYFVVWITLFSNMSLGSSMSQFGGGRPLYVLDLCMNTIAGYSRVTFLYTQQIISALTSAGPAQGSGVEICLDNTQFAILRGGSSGWYEFTPPAPQTNCFTNNYYSCVFRNDNF